MPIPVVTSLRKRVGEKVGHELLFKDKVYTPEDWAYQKSWKRYLPRPITSFRVFWGFSTVVVFLTLFSVCVCLYHSWLENIGAPKFWNDSQYLWQPFSLSSFCLALLLVHRTTASYNRWWEARTVWGGVLNVTRNLVREAASPWGFPVQAEPLLEMYARWVIAMPYLLKAHLELTTARHDLEEVLPPDELEYLLAASHPCLRCAQVVSSLIGKAMPGPEFQQARVWIDEQVVLYVNYVGACERIIKTAIPVAFTRHLTRFLLTWLLLLPFCLWPIVGWATPAVEGVLSFLLLGTENIGIQVEEPFCIMTMGAFCRSCESSVVEIMKTYKGASAFVEQVRRTDRSWGFERRKVSPAETVVNGLDSNANGSKPEPKAGQRKSFSDVDIKVVL